MELRPTIDLKILSGQTGRQTYYIHLEMAFKNQKEANLMEWQN